jgi:hypothetical protein
MATYGILNISDSRSLYYDDFDIAKIDLTDTSVRTGLVLGTQATLLALVGLVVSARIYSRVGITGRLFAEDGSFFFFAFTFFLGGWGWEEGKVRNRGRARK